MKDRKDVAESLYVDSGWTQKRIAANLEVSEQTVSRWAGERDWDNKKQRKLVSRKTLIDRNIELLDYELECNQRFVNEQREAQTFKPIPSGNVDKLIKLMSTLKLPEVTPGYSIQVIREFMEYIENQDLKLAKSILSLADKFVVEQTVKGQ